MNDMTCVNACVMYRLNGVVVSVFDCNVVELVVVSYLTDNTIHHCCLHAPFCLHNISGKIICCQYISHNAGIGGKHGKAITNKRGRPSRDVNEAITNKRGRPSRDADEAITKKRRRPSRDADEDAPRTPRLRTVPRPQRRIRLDKVDHFPKYHETRGRCRLCTKGYTQMMCTKCGVLLCLNKVNNCFMLYHTE